VSPALLLVSALTALAQAQVSINAEVDKTRVALDDQIVLSVTVSGAEAALPEPQLPALANFSVYSSGRNQSISFINGKVSSSVVYTYVLVPHFVGAGAIGPISVATGGARAQTQPIAIQVDRPGASQAGPPARAAPTAASPQGARGGGSSEVFVTAEVDKKKAYVNEQVTLTVRFYTAVSLLGNPQYNAPKISGFIAEDLPPERHGNVNIRGRTYYYSEIKTALFPAQAGRLTIGPAAVRCQVQQDVTVDPFAADFFQKFFSQGLTTGQTRELNSEPIVITAEPLPENGKPADFSGAVGRLSIAAAVDRAKAKVGEALGLTTTVQGEGNLKAIADPRLAELPSFRVYETVSSLNLDKRNDRVRGSKVFKTLLLPRVSGDLTLPPITFSYFDPQKRAYVRVETLPIAIKAAPPAPGSAPVGGTGAPQQGGLQQLTSVTQDIRYLKTRRGRSTLGLALESVAGAGPLNALPLLLFAVSLGWFGYRELGAADPKGRRFRLAYRTACARIKEAGRAKDPHLAVGLLGETLGQYLADKLDQTASGLTLRQVQQLLRSRRVPVSDPLIERVKVLWDELDLRRFAPAAKGTEEDQAHLARTLKSLLQDLEGEVRI